jgi:hypothetical protein
MKNIKEREKIVTLVFKATALAMAVAVVVLNIMNAASAQTQLLLAGICLFCLAISSLDQEEK